MSDTAATHETIDVGRLRARLGGLSPRQYWRSLDELAETDEFRNYVEREFPSQLAVWEDPVGRRKFLMLMAASLSLAGLAGCTRPPAETIVPYVQAPEELVPGKPLFFATALPRPGGAIGLLVESHMGRPTKIEGNPEHPASRGATDAQAQASILTMYDPDRSQTILRRGLIDTWDHFLANLEKQLEPLRANGGGGLRILTETVLSPTLGAQLEALLKQLPQARWHQYQPLNNDNVYAGAEAAFGQAVEPIYLFDQANVVVSLDADFLLTMPGAVRNARDFMQRRRGTGEVTNQNRLYVAESTPTITGAVADHRLPLGPQAIERLARAILEGLRENGSSTSVPGVSEQWLAAVISDLQANRGASLVLAGPQQPPAVHALAHAINNALGNAATTVTYVEPIAARVDNHRQSLTELVEAMRGGEVELLVILGGNPVYNTPGELDFATALDKVPLRVHLSQYHDETSQRCDWHVPEAHYLESWSDTRAYDGTASIVQPLIAPLYGGRTAHELVAALAGSSGKSAYELVQAHWELRLGTTDFGRRWRKAVHDGLITDTAAATVDVRLTTTDAAPPASLPGADEITIEFRADPTLGDGRDANNGWLQELPKPLTKLVWDNVALVSAATAEAHQLKNGDVLEITQGERSLRAPAWIMPGQPDNVVSLTLGYGRTIAGRVGTGVGYNAYELLPSDGRWFTAGSIRKTGDTYNLATTQNHHSMEGRDIVRVTTQARLHDGHGAPHDDKHHGPLPSLYPEDDYESQPNAWGMIVDQTACIGCNACVVACQAENNIPVVGKEQVDVGREMHWLRIDRYFHGELDNPETYFQPMMCVHCEKAPCEVVCPVAATVHSAEGLNEMVYNRCVGTRYCSNNCPYKVRRFNFLQYSDETTPSLALLRNPDVTVRSRGVMEKCTYCVQRINVGRIAAKRDNRNIADGEVVTACQQACPTDAIIFGNLNDAKAKVNQLKASPLNYGVLAELNTQPRTTYLPRIVNPHPTLPEPTAVPRDNEPRVDKAHSS
jgi:MoCo/4Fe-4S cofactor protein with predicted Tat translocation signal